jgi:hypothetical protein
LADRRDAGSGQNFRPETQQESYDRQRAEQAAVLERAANRDEYLKANDPAEYARQERDKQLKAERQERDSEIKQAWARGRSGDDSQGQNNKWDRHLTDKARAEVQKIQREGPEDRDRSGRNR